MRVFGSAGYRGGATARLTTRDGRYTSDVHLSSDDLALPTAGLLAALGAGPEVAAAVVTTAGCVVPLPGRDLPLLLAGPSGLVERCAPGGMEAAVHRPPPSARRVGAQGCRLDLTAVAGGTLATTRPANPPYGLSVRELGISERTVAHHVEHLLGSLASGAGPRPPEPLWRSGGGSSPPPRRDVGVSRAAAPAGGRTRRRPSCAPPVRPGRGRARGTPARGRGGPQ